MLTNSKMTHYAKKINPSTRIEEWTRKVYDDVLWQGGKGASLNKGYIDGNDVRVRIPYSTNEIDISNFKIGDIIVKGEKGDISTQDDLEDTFNITSIVDNNFGSSNIRHVHLEGE